MKKTIIRITLFLMIITLTLTATSCSKVNSKYQGTYTSSSASIVVHKNTVDLNNVPIGITIYRVTSTGYDAFEFTLSTTGMAINSQEISTGCYKITGQTLINGQVTNITAYLYDGSGNPYITLAGTTYYK